MAEKQYPPFLSLRARVAVSLFNLGIRILPQGYRSKVLLKNMTRTGHIKGLHE